MLVATITNIVLVLILASCSTQEFAGDAGSQRVVKPKTPPKTNPSEDITLQEGKPKDPQNELVTDDGGKSLTCDPNSMVDDPNASESIGGAQNLVNIVNGICGAKLSNQYYGNGSVHNDPKTANAVCRFKGYKTGQVTKSGTYFSPRDNFIGMWEGVDVSTVTDLSPISGVFKVYKATHSNKRMMGLSCKGKLKAACVPKAQTINCK